MCNCSNTVNADIYMYSRPSTMHICNYIEGGTHNGDVACIGSDLLCDGGGIGE